MRKRARGFTLIEVMMTILIIGVAAMVVVFNTPTQRFGDSAEDAAERFLQQMHHAREQALLRNYVYGIEVEDNSYSFYRWEEQAWQLVTETPLAPVTAPELVSIELEMGDFRLLDNMEDDRDAIFGRDVRRDNQEEEVPKPTILIFESTEFVPFSLLFTNTETNTSIFAVDGRSGIQLQLEERDTWY
ncbi:type II secretion system protein GspH [Aliidiomarina iranensis]|uniref:Type II secretion system protein H n=1 Tax=Aliidiomarina iranensis TaxID=1434071 RepID=A0A432W318_9GAMM|nr:type II secretion system minor pseudopilin GspH [Aliidiomarina iranensis]RUO23631.1 type II secretion system protein GspH [Aliidiomarina iranensis]